jgi:hypothetical protein
MGCRGFPWRTRHFGRSLQMKTLVSNPTTAPVRRPQVAEGRCQHGKRLWAQHGVRGRPAAALPDLANIPDVSPYSKSSRSRFGRAHRLPSRRGAAPTVRPAEFVCAIETFFPVIAHAAAGTSGYRCGLPLQQRRFCPWIQGAAQRTDALGCRARVVFGFSCFLRIWPRRLPPRVPLLHLWYVGKYGL